MWCTIIDFLSHLQDFSLLEEGWSTIYGLDTAPFSHLDNIMPSRMEDPDASCGLSHSKVKWSQSSLSNNPLSQKTMSHLLFLRLKETILTGRHFLLWTVSQKRLLIYSQRTTETWQSTFFNISMFLYFVKFKTVHCDTTRNTVLKNRPSSTLCYQNVHFVFIE